jgi:hypothetical protein
MEKLPTARSHGEVLMRLQEQFLCARGLQDIQSHHDDLNPTIISALGFAQELLVAQDQSNSFFSKNEELDDISSSNLRFVLPNFYAGMLHVWYMPPAEPGARYAHLEKAKAHLNAFLLLAERIKVIHSEDRKALSAEGPKDATSRRDELIARDRRDKEAKIKIEGLIKKRRELVEKKGLEAAEQHEEDNEADRELAVLDIQMKAREAIKELKMIEQEIVFVQMAMRGAPVGPPGAKKPAAPAAPPSSQALALLNKQFQERDDKKAQVFQPGWTQPWQTIEEFGEEEYRRMKAAEKARGPPPAAPDPDKQEDDDEEVKKKRAWDDWADDHKRGSGNTYRHG